MKNSQVASIARRTLFESDEIQIGTFEATPGSDRSGDIERQSLNAVVLPLAGVFSKHDAPGRHVIGTPSHAVLITANTPYRVSFPGGVGDRAIILRFDDALGAELVSRQRGNEPLRSDALLSAEAMIRRNLLRQRTIDPDADRFEIEALGLELLSMCLRALRCGSLLHQPAVRLRRTRAVERVKEAVAVAPADTWSIARLGSIANLSPFHLCHVFHELVGTSIYDYVVRERLSQALSALLDSSEDITAIALDAGFASHSHFTARFRRFFGCTPTALRRGASAEQVSQLRKIMTARASTEA